MSRMPIKVTNRVTATEWTFSGVMKASRELHIDPRYIADYCKGKRKFHNNVYIWSFVNEVKGDSKNV